MPEDGRVTGISRFQLLLGGVSTPQLLRPDPAAPNVLILTMSEVGQKAVLSGTVAGAESGAILLEKM